MAWFHFGLQIIRDWIDKSWQTVANLALQRLHLPGCTAWQAHHFYFVVLL
ncbi:MAG TPA: hypothetical protein VGF67_14825 [Ktedonobacteraceae bacterium]|jgi:hypothetical protein